MQIRIDAVHPGTPTMVGTFVAGVGFAVRCVNLVRSSEFDVPRDLTHDAKAQPPEAERRQVWTIGHWICPEPAFTRPLHAQRIDLIADVRSQPGSRRSPQFGREQLTKWLAQAGIGYVHLPELGGRRGRQRVDPDINAGWRLPSFKNYADYSLGADYERGIRRLTELATARRVAIMCGEPMPWRCHRLIIANTLTARGWVVWHLIDDDSPRQHELGKWGAQPLIGADGKVTYPATFSADPGITCTS